VAGNLVLRPVPVPVQPSKPDIIYTLFEALEVILIARVVCHTYVSITLLLLDIYRACRFLALLTVPVEG
jgi:hypothetical protein